MRYPGGKNRLYQKIINLIPRHRLYVELFGGSGAVARHLERGQAEAWVVELDQVQATRLRLALPGHRVICGDALELLAEHASSWGPDVVVLADPPYPIPDRRSMRALYRCELDQAAHDRLCELLRATRARVLVCGHPWGSYPQAFADWTRHEFEVTTRAGRPGVECIWSNFRDPYPLHDYRYFGADKRLRQDMRRQVARNVRRFGAMDRHQRAAVLRALVARYGAP